MMPNHQEKISGYIVRRHDGTTAGFKCNISGEYFPIIDGDCAAALERQYQHTLACYMATGGMDSKPMALRKKEYLEQQ